MSIRHLIVSPDTSAAVAYLNHKNRFGGEQYLTVVKAGELSHVRLNTYRVHILGEPDPGVMRRLHVMAHDAGIPLDDLLVAS